VKGEHLRSEQGREWRAGARAGKEKGSEGRACEVRRRKGRESRG
jgi:hypothetical protein